MSKHVVQWASPSPLWARFAPPSAMAGSAQSLLSGDQIRPAILRFASDDFMDQLLATLTNDPKQLSEFLARPETWRTPLGDGPDLIDREPLPRPARMLRRLKAARRPKSAVDTVDHDVTALEKSEPRTIPLKLYQPAHQRYYLVAADLMCATVGFPKRALATGGREQIGFVIRRLLPSSTAGSSPVFVEHAFVKDKSGAHWRSVEAANAGSGLCPGEELLPLFAMNFQDDSGYPRRMIGGMIPVGRREEYMSTGVDNGPEDPGGRGAGKTGVATTKVSARKELFKLEVSEPWKNMIRTVFAIRQSILDPLTDPMPTPKRDDAARRINDQMQMQSWLVLLDLADYLKTHVTPVWDAVLDPTRRTALNTKQRIFFDWLDGAKVPPALLAATQPPVQAATSLRDALRQIAASGIRTSLESTTALYPDAAGENLSWPDFRFLLVGLDNSYGVAGLHPSLGDSKYPETDPEDKEPVTGKGLTEFLQEIQDAQNLVDRLVALVVGAFDPESEDPGVPLPFAATVQRALMATAGDPGWFVIHCVFVRCDCGSLQPPLLSAPTQRFQLAGFFDPDAPARPIRIALPLDTTPAGLRKFNKNTALVISDVLCGQIARAKGLGLVDLVRAVLPWPLHKDLDVGGMGPCKNTGGDNIGMICSLSIPIVTICALILLLIIASILDYIFRWMPYLIMCFPLPKFKAKKVP